MKISKIKEKIFAIKYADLKNNVIAHEAIAKYTCMYILLRITASRN